MEVSKDSDILYVQMFGNFSLTWKGKPLLGTAKSSETKSAYLMQLLIQ